MPWTQREKRFLLSAGSPLTDQQKDKMETELHADPSLGHAHLHAIPRLKHINALSLRPRRKKAS